MSFMSSLEKLGFYSIIDLLGFISNILYVLTPLLFNMLIDHNSFEIESISIMSVFSMYCNAFIYFFLTLFGENIGNNFVLRDYTNLLGTFLGIVYLAIYYYERYKDENIKYTLLNYIIVISLTGIMIAFEYYFIILNYTETHNNIFKWIGVLPNVLEYFPIGYNIFYLIRKKKAKIFLVIGATFGLFNSTIWFIWALRITITNKNEPQYHSLLANILSISLNILQFYVYCKYRNNNEKIYYSFGKIKSD